MFCWDCRRALGVGSQTVTETFLQPQHHITIAELNLTDMTALPSVTAKTKYRPAKTKDRPYSARCTLVAWNMKPVT